MDGKNNPPRAAILLIGDELLRGQTRDANLSWIARRLVAQGIQVAEARVVADEAEAILAALDGLRKAHDWVLTTGGIGPTHDDITADVVARAFGVEIGVNAEARRRLEEHYAGSEYVLNASRLRMARIPEGARLLDNPISAAPGFVVGNVVVMAGVPEIMRVMLEHALTLLPGGVPEEARGARVFLGEGDLAAPLRELQAAWEGVGGAEAVRIGCYPSFRDGRAVGVRVVARSRDVGRVEACFSALLEVLRGLGAEAEILSPEEMGVEEMRGADAGVAER